MPTRKAETAMGVEGRARMTRCQSYRSFFQLRDRFNRLRAFEILEEIVTLCCANRNNTGIWALVLDRKARLQLPIIRAR
jgi:hypothetical protein